MKEKGLVLVVAFFFSFALFAEQKSNENGGKEIENLISAVKAASPGDYIVLSSGKRYILTKEEIAIAKGDFNYEDLSAVKTETRDDGTEIKTISQAHTAYIYPDGQSTHILKTSISFTAFMKYIDDTYHIAYYIDYNGEANEFTAVESPEFDVFRASVQFQTISDGIDELKALTVTVYNYGVSDTKAASSESENTMTWYAAVRSFHRENFMMKYCSKPEMAWGYISDKGTYKPTGETHQIEFGVE